MAAYAKDVRVEGGSLVVSSQAYGGKLMAEVAPEGDMAIVACLAGSFPVEAGQGSTAAPQALVYGIGIAEPGATPLTPTLSLRGTS